MSDMHGGPQGGEIVKISWVIWEGGKREGMGDENMRD